MRINLNAAAKAFAQKHGLAVQHRENYGPSNEIYATWYLADAKGRVTHKLVLFCARCIGPEWVWSGGVALDETNTAHLPQTLRRTTLLGFEENISGGKKATALVKQRFCDWAEKLQPLPIPAR